MLLTQWTFVFKDSVAGVVGRKGGGLSICRMGVLSGFVVGGCCRGGLSGSRYLGLTCPFVWGQSFPPAERHSLLVSTQGSINLNKF